MLLTRPVEQLTWDDVDSFCRQGIPEGAYLDYKQNFPAHLENTVAAMANTLGGTILIGISEDAQSKPVIPINGIPFQRGLSEKVMGIILTNITPPVIPAIGVCTSANGNDAIVVIRVPQSHQTPHAISNNTQVYIRTGNRNQPEALASVDKIEWLRDKRRKSEELRETLYEQADSRLANLAYPTIKEPGRRQVGALIHGWLRISLCPFYPQEPFRTPSEMNDLLEEIKVKDYYNTFITFPSDKLSWTIAQDGIFIKEGPYYTELNCFGLYCYKQKLLEGDYQGIEKKAENVIFATKLFCRADEFLDSAIKFYNRLGYPGILDFNMHLNVWGCGLRPYYRQSTTPAGEPELHFSPDPEIQFAETVLAHELQAEKGNLLFRAIQRFAWAFGWNVDRDLLDHYYKKYKGKSVFE